MTGRALTIRNDREFSAAIERAQELMGCTNGSDEERELAEIADAVDAYAEIIRTMLTRKPHNDNTGFFI